MSTERIATELKPKYKYIHPKWYDEPMVIQLCNRCKCNYKRFEWDTITLLCGPCIDERNDKIINDSYLKLKPDLDKIK